MPGNVPTAVAIYIEVDFKKTGDAYLYWQNADVPGESNHTRRPIIISIADYNGDQEQVIREVHTTVQQIVHEQLLKFAPQLLRSEDALRSRSRQTRAK